MNKLQQIEKEHAEQISELREVNSDFAPGDTVRIQLKLEPTAGSRTQYFEGVCIARSGTGVRQSFTLRKLSFGEGVERVFPLYSGMIVSLKVMRRGRVRRAKLYYLRNLTGKAARIREKGVI